MNDYNGTLRGPRTSTMTKQPRRPIQFRVPSKTIFAQQQEPILEPKTEIIDYTSLPSPVSSTKTIQEEEPTPIIREKKLPPKPIYRKPVSYYSSDESEGEDPDDEEILRDLTSSRIRIDDIKLSDDEDEDDDDEEEEEQVEREKKPTVIEKKPTKTDLPPIPQIVAPDSSDDENQLPFIVVPGEEDESEMEPSDEIYDSIYYGIRCAGCKKPLKGNAITMSNKSWHPQCLKCQVCHIKLEHIQCLENDGTPYCALDFHELFSPRCEYCKTPIESGRWLTALNKNYHIGHLFCRECGNPFEQDANYSEKDGHVYCEKDYKRLFSMKCKGCSEPISNEYVTALNGTWHRECFVCIDCGSSFTSSTFMVKGGRPHCGKECQGKTVPKKLGFKKLPSLEFIPTTTPTKESSFADLQDIDSLKKCHRCQTSIQGACFSAFGYDYHMSHFRCIQCNKALSSRITKSYEEVAGGEIICKSCVRKQ